MKEKTFKACLRIIEKEGWKNFSFSKVSAEEGIPLQILHAEVSSPSEIMIHLFRKVDERVLKNMNFSSDLSSKDILFDIFMTRFDALQPYKPVMKSFWKECFFTPEDFPSLTCQGYSSMTWMLEAAHLNGRGLSGFMRVQGLTALYMYTLRTWLKDDTPDLSQTMVALDLGLTKLEKAAQILRVF